MSDTDEEATLYAEEEKILQVLRRFCEPRPADYPATFRAEDLEHADRLRQRLRAIQARLDMLQTKKLATTD